MHYEVTVELEDMPMRSSNRYLLSVPHSLVRDLGNNSIMIHFTRENND
jgi:hypothetical protein